MASSDITVYTSYKKGTTTISGSFPVYNSISLAGNCEVPTPTSAQLADLDEFADILYLVGTDRNRNTNTIYIDVNKAVIDPNESGILTDEILLNVSSLSKALAHPVYKPVAPKRYAPVYQKVVNTGIDIPGPPIPAPIYISTTPPAIPCQGTPPNCGGATITVSFDGRATAKFVNIYISNYPRELGSLQSTSFNYSGTYQFTGLIGGKTYYISIVNDKGERSSQLAVTTPAYMTYLYVTSFPSLYLATSMSTSSAVINAGVITNPLLKPKQARNPISIIKVGAKEAKNPLTVKKV